MLRIYDSQPQSSPEKVGLTWSINGFPATLMIWTDAQWSQLDVQPHDAQRYPDGYWCTLRMD
jgi:hypothetical protein